MTTTTLNTILRGAVERLRATSTSPHLDAQLLLGHCLKQSLAWILAHPERLIDGSARTRFNRLVDRRCRGEPVAYLTGVREFWALSLRVSPATLVPRPETELVVERALANIPPDADWRVADLGTGSGAIALAIAHERPLCRLLATDFCNDALQVAERNAKHFGLNNVHFALGSWYAALSGERFELIVSNPPYIADGDPHLQSSDLRFEPKIALPAGPGGLDALTEIARGAPEHLGPNGILIVEHGFEQQQNAYALLSDGGFCEVSCYRDYAGQPRVTEGHI